MMPGMIPDCKTGVSPEHLRGSPTVKQNKNIMGNLTFSFGFKFHAFSISVFDLTNTKWEQDSKIFPTICEG